MPKRSGGPPFKAQVIERTFYPPLLDVIRAKGGAGIQEVQYNSVPDIEFELLGLKWILSVKLGESLGVIKGAFLQYMRHKDESAIERGILLILPDKLRKTAANESALRKAIESTPITVLIDAGPVKTEFRDATFPEVLDRLLSEVGPLLLAGSTKHYSLSFVIDMLREQVTETMESLTLGEQQILKLVTDLSLLSDLAHVDRKQAKEVATFLAAYVFLSQVLFLRLFAVVHPHILESGTTRVNRKRLRKAFEDVLEINYKPIFELEVIDSIPDGYLEETFRLVWGMEVEHVRYELPGRLFHELMPFQIRKLLAAFYTRPHAAELLARLVIENANSIILDPACGSGTILTAAYRRKRELHKKTSRSNPHRKFCEQQIYGADMMPFAVHLTSANLAAMDVATTIEKTLILQGDSLEIVAGKTYQGGIHQFDLFSKTLSASKVTGESYRFVLPKEGVDCVLMNPPFTKTERGIAKFVDMDKFKEVIGGEVGLWAHFISLVDLLLAEDGICGAVIPISILRGRESTKIRDFVFKKWTPLAIVKSTRSYAFSESSEYRDILLICRKGAAKPSDKVKVCYIKSPLPQLTHDRVEFVAGQIESRNHLRSSNLDIETFSVSDFRSRPANMLFFAACEDLDHRHVLVQFIERFSDVLQNFPPEYFGEGYRPVPKGVSKALFLTRGDNPARTEEAHLRFTDEEDDKIHAETAMGAKFSINKSELERSLRTPVGLNSFDITQQGDYITREPHNLFSAVRRSTEFKEELTGSFWNQLHAELETTKTKIVVARRLDYGSPNFHLISWFSDVEFSPSNQVNVIRETDNKRAKSLCVILNSIIFLANYFLIKEQSHARYADIRFYDLYEMLLYPASKDLAALGRIYSHFRKKKFPALRLQLDQNFDQRYREFWESKKEGVKQQGLWTVLEKKVDPIQERVDLDLAVCDALGVPMTRPELLQIYEVLVKEIMISRRLEKD